MLQELTVDNFVPNDTYLNAAAHNVSLISGPNTSGKSVYLKQVMHAISRRLCILIPFITFENSR